MFWTWPGRESRSVAKIFGLVFRFLQMTSPACQTRGDVIVAEARWGETGRVDSRTAEWSYPNSSRPALHRPRLWSSGEAALQWFPTKRTLGRNTAFSLTLRLWQEDGDRGSNTPKWLFKKQNLPWSHFLWFLPYELRKRRGSSRLVLTQKQKQTKKTKRERTAIFVDLWNGKKSNGCELSVVSAR